MSKMWCSSVIDTANNKNCSLLTSTLQSNIFRVHRSFIMSWYTSNRSTWWYQTVSLNMSLFVSLIFFAFIFCFSLSCTFAISTVRLVPSLMLSQDNEAPLVALNLQSSNKHKWLLILKSTAIFNTCMFLSKLCLDYNLCTMTSLTGTITGAPRLNSDNTQQRGRVWYKVFEIFNQMMSEKTESLSMELTYSELLYWHFKEYSMLATCHNDGQNIILSISQYNCHNYNYKSIYTGLDSHLNTSSKKDFFKGRETHFPQIRQWARIDHQRNYRNKGWFPFSWDDTKVK